MGQARQFWSGRCLLQFLHGFRVFTLFLVLLKQSSLVMKCIYSEKKNILGSLPTEPVIFYQQTLSRLLKSLYMHSLRPLSVRKKHNQRPWISQSHAPSLQRQSSQAQYLKKAFVNPRMLLYTADWRRIMLI
jgi:hypothetical protein